MKRIILLLCFAIMSSFCFSTCDKTEKKGILQVEVDDKHLQKFEDYLNAFINNDDIAFEKLKNGEIAPCESISSLIQYYLQDKDEETCLLIVKLAVDNNGNMVSGMDFSGPIIESCKLNYYRLTEYLLTTEAKKYINHPASQYAPALFWAIQNGNVNLIELLLRNGADPNSETHYSRTYMNEIEDFIDDNILSLEKASKIVSLLIQYGYKI